MKRAKLKQIGHPLRSPGLLVTGDVVAIPLKAARFAYARHYDGASLAILEIAPTSGLLPIDAVQSSGTEVAFFVEYCEPIDRPEWIYIGQWKFPSREASTPPKRYVEDVAFPGRFQILDGHRMYPATKDEVAGLQKHGLLDPETIKKKVQEYFSETKTVHAGEPPVRIDEPALEDASDEKTFAPFILADRHHGRARTLNLIFADWDWLARRLGTDTVDGYYLNGYGVEGLVKAARWEAGLKSSRGKINYNSEGDTCYIEFTDLDDARATARLTQAAFRDRRRLRALIAVAKRRGFGS